MKRILLILAAILAAIALLIQLVPYGHEHGNPPVSAEPQWPDPQTRQLAVRACFDCHSNQTVWPWYSYIAPVSWLVYGDVQEGRRRLNFSDWNRPQGQYAMEFSSVYFENSMPPSKYLLLHPAARLSPQERKQLFDGLAILAANYHP